MQLKLFSFIMSACLAAAASGVWAQSGKKAVAPSAQQHTLTTSSTDAPESNKFVDRLGMSYFFFFDGWNLEEGQDVVTNRMGRTKNPINSYYLISFKYKLTDRFYLDAQTGSQHWYTRDPRAKFDRIRVGLSGNLWKAGAWSLDGAANSDLPYTGYTAQQRRLLFSPGLFAGLSWRPTNSPWSFYALVMPRVWFYSDRTAVESEWTAAKRDPGEKFESIIQFTPTVNYAITDKFGLRSGLGLDYRKWVKDEWATWRRWDTPLTAGVTYAFSKQFNVYTFLQSFPLDSRQRGLNRGPMNGFRNDTSSVGMWLSGTLF
jgi:hypothetical protein